MVFEEIDFHYDPVMTWVLKRKDGMICFRGVAGELPERQEAEAEPLLAALAFAEVVKWCIYLSRAQSQCSRPAGS